MLLLYNLLQLVLAPVALPALLAAALFREKHRRRLRERFGFGLAAIAGALPDDRPRVWVHALSVGEVRSCRPLVQAIREECGNAVIVLSTTTASGRAMAEGFGAEVDALLAFPFDILPVVRRFQRLVRPDIFILVETDFWPNFLLAARNRGLPVWLVNGRMSAASLRRYRSHRWFFGAIFGSFTRILLQNQNDVAAMRELAGTAAEIVAAGNLKYDAALGVERLAGPPPATVAGRRVLVAGSTHAGEEEILLAVAARLRSQHPDLLLVLAPRDVTRARQLVGLAEGMQLAAACLSDGGGGEVQVLILDRLGALVRWYGAGEVAFVGGSLVAEGGHNPLEPAVLGKPVLFGSFMEDFADIAADLLAAGAAIQVGDGEDLFRQVSRLLADPRSASLLGERAKALVAANRGAARRTAVAVRRTLAGEDGHGPA
ncbi:MAG: glycosyltransferase N-terminal domain-containing protein [Thermodesulfobacteriota bacterium]